MKKSSRILVTGASGLIGSALVRLLKAEGYTNVLTPPYQSPNYLDIRNFSPLMYYFEQNEPEYVFHLAAYVGGIKDNQDRCAEFIHNNTLMQSNIIYISKHTGVKKLLFPGSTCAYPAITDRKIKESDFLTGRPEETNLAYALAKQNGIVMAQSYAKQYGMKVVLPMVANTYGLNDRSSHVIPMMIEKIREGKPVFWGTGTPIREFIYADDVASAFLFLMLNYDSSEIINVGTGEEYDIRTLADRIYWAMKKRPDYTFDSTKPDGTARKCLDSSKITALGWAPSTFLMEGLRRVCDN